MQPEALWIRLEQGVPAESSGFGRRMCSMGLQQHPAGGLWPGAGLTWVQMQSTPSHWDMQGSVPGLQLLKTFCPAVDVRAAVVAIQKMMGLQARAEK